MYHRRYNILQVLISILAVWFVISPAQARTARYVARLPEVGEAGAIRGYDTHTHRTLWSLRNAMVLSSAWSHDRHCFALVWLDDIHWKNGRRLTIWYTGHMPRTYVGLPDPMEQYQDKNSTFNTDYIIDIVWSPDNRALLMRTTGSGGAYSTGFGILWYINIYRYRARLLVKRCVAGAEWVSPTKVAYTFVIPGGVPRPGYMFEEHDRTIRINPQY